MQSLTYRTAGAWGAGNGSDLSATQVDTNFWNLFEAVTELEAVPTGAGIDYISQPTNGDQFYIHLTNHEVLGPFTIPTSHWNPRGNWQPSTLYSPFDTVSDDGALYLVAVAVTSAATFSPFATSGGQSVYILILSAPEDALPSGGTVGQRLVWQGGSPVDTAWQNDTKDLALFIPGQPTAGSILLQYAVADHMTLPVGLEGSVAFAGVPTLTTVSYSLFQNGNAIGAIIFTGPSPEGIEIEFTAAVNFVPGDILSMNAPAAPDTQQANISITLQALLT